MNLQGNVNQLIGQIGAIKKLGDIANSQPAQPQVKPKKPKLNAARAKKKAMSNMKDNGQAAAQQRKDYVQHLQQVRGTRMILAHEMKYKGGK